MSNCRAAPILALFLMLVAQPAWAFLDPPYITPAHPTSDDAITINVYGGECDVLNIGIVPPVVAEQGNAISVLFTGIHEGDPEWCYYGVGTVTYSVGTLSPGSYMLDVERRYMTIFGTWTQETLGLIPFTVIGVPPPPPAQPISAPTLSAAGLTGLLLVLIAAALRVLRGRARPNC